KSQTGGAVAAVVASLAILLAATEPGRAETPAPPSNGAASAAADGGAQGGGRTLGKPATGGRGVTSTIASIMDRARARGLGRRPVVFNAEEPRRRPFMPADAPQAPAG